VNVVHVLTYLDLKAKCRQLQRPPRKLDCGLASLPRSEDVPTTHLSCNVLLHVLQSDLQACFFHIRLIRINQVSKRPAPQLWSGHELDQLASSIFSSSARILVQHLLPYPPPVLKVARPLACTTVVQDSGLFPCRVVSQTTLMLGRNNKGARYRQEKTALTRLKGRRSRGEYTMDRAWAWTLALCTVGPFAAGTMGALK